MIYYDNAATTKVYDECVEILTEYNQNRYFNPSALYKEASDIKLLIDGARESIKKRLRAPEGNLYFTSSGSEADNTALFGVRKQKGQTVIVGEGEHDAIYNSALQLKNDGYKVEFAPIKSNGQIDVEKLGDMLNPDVCLVSVMHVSNETGAINDLERATKKAYAMVAYFGMSDKLPNLCYYSNNEYSFNRPYSEKTAELIDEEVKRMVNEQYERAKQILSEHKEGHQQLAQLLIDKEVIFAEDVEHIFGPRPWTSRSEEIMAAVQTSKEMKELAEKEAQKASQTEQDVEKQKVKALPGTDDKQEADASHAGDDNSRTAGNTVEEKEK